MYAIRFSKYLGKVDGQSSFSKKPDGMFLRKDGGHTDHKGSARVFETVEEAVTAAPTVSRPAAAATDSEGRWTLGKIEARVFVVEVTTRPVIHEQTSVVCEF